MRGTARHSDRKCPCLPHLKQTRDGSHSPECCAAAAADVTADTSGAAVAAPVADITGAADDIAADARAAALADAAADNAVVAADAAADTAVVVADARDAALADAAADVAAAVDSTGDLYRRACRVRRHWGLHVPCSARRFWL